MERKEAASAETSLIEVFEKNDKINIRCTPKFITLAPDAQQIIIDNISNYLLIEYLDKFPLITVYNNIKKTCTIDIICNSVINNLPEDLLTDYINKGIKGLEEYRDSLSGNKILLQ